MKVKLSLDNVVQVFFKINNMNNRKEFPKLKQQIIEEMVERGGLPIWQLDEHGRRSKILKLIQFNELVDL